jgi:hypothetical protein
MNASSQSRSTTTQYWGRYTPDEVEALVEGYAEFQNYRYKPFLMVRLLDLERGLRYTSRPHALAIP